MLYHLFFFFFSSRRRHTRLQGDWSSDVCSSDLESIETVVSETGVPRLSLISGARNSLDIESLKHFQKSRLLRVLMALPADVVLLDLGAGTSVNVLDLFSLADRGLLVILPEPTSIENC